jgi:hypothetical protein
MSAGASERSSEFWRKLETEAREIAARMADPEPQRMMLFIAESYQHLADRAEARKTQQK